MLAVASGGGSLPQVSPNQVLAGPAAGVDPAKAAGRALVAADIPALDYAVSGHDHSGVYAVIGHSHTGYVVTVPAATADNTVTGSDSIIGVSVTGTYAGATGVTKPAFQMTLNIAADAERVPGTYGAFAGLAVTTDVAATAISTTPYLTTMVGKLNIAAGATASYWGNWIEAGTIDPAANYADFVPVYAEWLKPLPVDGLTAYSSYINIAPTQSASGGSLWFWGDYFYIDSASMTAPYAQVYGGLYDFETNANGTSKVWGISIVGTFNNPTGIVKAFDFTPWNGASSGTIYGLHLGFDNANATYHAIYAKRGHVTLNDSGADYDVRIEGDTNANLVFVDASADAVGFGTNAPTATVQILSSAAARIPFAVVAHASQSGNLSEWRANAGTPLAWLTSAGVGSYPGVSVPRTLGMESADKVINGTFDADTDWTKGTGWTISGGVATKAAGVASNLSQSGATWVELGGVYRVRFTISGFASGSVQVAIGGRTHYMAYNGNGSYDITIPAANTSTGALTFIAASNFAGSIDNVIVTKLTPWLAAYSELGEIRAGLLPVGQQAGDGNRKAAYLYLGGFKINDATEQTFLHAEATHNDDGVRFTFPVASGSRWRVYIASTLVQEVGTGSFSYMKRMQVQLGTNGTAAAPHFVVGNSMATYVHGFFSADHVLSIAGGYDNAGPNLNFTAIAMNTDRNTPTNRYIKGYAPTSILWNASVLTDTVANVLIIGHNSTGTPAASYGTGLSIQGKSSTTSDRDMGRIRALWQTATDASRAADLIFTAYNTTNEHEGLRIRGGASGPEIGFLGATPAAQQTGGVATAGGTYGGTEQTMLQACYDALRTFGLLS